MTELQDGMLLYHGSYCAVETISLDQCVAGKDFGKGFYVTASYDQAKRFIPLSIRKHSRIAGDNDNNKGYVSVYQLHLNDAIRIHCFEGADRDWLHFVAANRRTDLFQELRSVYQPFDVIGGKVANDQTARTLQLYVTGAYGQPGSENADQFAIRELLPNKLDDQYCFLTEAAVNCLTFIRSEAHAVDS